MERVRGDQQERGDGMLRGFQGGRQKGREQDQEQRRGGDEGTRRKEEGRARVSDEREEGPRRRDEGRTDEGGRREEGRRRVEDGGGRREEGRLRIEEGFGRRDERRREETFTNRRANHSRTEGWLFNPKTKTCFKFPSLLNAFQLQQITPVQDRKVCQSSIR